MLRKYLYKQCRKCGTPKIVSRTYKWGNGGTMSLQFQGAERTALINASLYDDLVEAIDNKLGVPVWHIIFESLCNSGKKSLEYFFQSGPLVGRLKKYQWSKPIIIHSFQELSALMGYCYSKSIEPTSEVVRSAYVKNPFNLHCVAAAIVSAFEAMDQMPFDFYWKHVSENEHIINIKPVFEKPPISDRLVHTPPSVIEGKLNLKRCPVCGVPRRASEIFEWQPEEGLLMHKESRDRLCSFASTALSSVFEVISSELDFDTKEFLTKTQCERTINHLGRLGITSRDPVMNKRDANLAFRRYVGDFPVYGYGNPTALNIDEGYYSVTVENPFFAEMIAGILLGLYKGLFRKEAEIEWESPEENRTVYTIRSK